MKLIMYHYVREYSDQMPHFRHLEVDEFSRQLDYFQRELGFVSRDDFFAALAGGKPVPGVVLTFDDGFSDHFEFVLPELLKRGLWGMFYVPTGMYGTGKLLDVHRIHCLLGRYGGQVVLDAARRLIRDEMFSHARLAEFRQATYSRQTNDDATLQFKRLMNYFLTEEYRGQILDVLMAELLDESALVNSFYMQPAELAEMQRQGMLIGGHSVSHPVFSKLPESQQRREIEECFATLDRETGGIRNRSFCYPYGGFHSFNATTMRLLEEAGCEFALNVEPRDVTERDFKLGRFALPRYDCNQFPHGQCAINRVSA